MSYILLYITEMTASLVSCQYKDGLLVIDDHENLFSHIYNESPYATKIVS